MINFSSSLFILIVGFRSSAFLAMPYIDVFVLSLVLSYNELTCVEGLESLVDLKKLNVSVSYGLRFAQRKCANSLVTA